MLSKALFLGIFGAGAIMFGGDAIKSTFSMPSSNSTASAPANQDGISGKIVKSFRKSSITPLTDMMTEMDGDNRLSNNRSASQKPAPGLLMSKLDMGRDLNGNARSQNPWPFPKR